MYNADMELYVFNVSPLRARMDEGMARLSPARREKAERLRREDARLGSVGAGLLLQRFFPGLDASVLPGGKPFFPGDRFFNLSHSGELAVIALADVPVGVDVQRVGPVSEALRRRVLTEAELSREDRDFFFFWTRKEAALKCLGVGLDRKLSSLDVSGESVTPDARTLRLHTVRLREYYLSAAAEGDAFFVPRELTLDELLSGKERL